MLENLHQLTWPERRLLQDILHLPNLPVQTRTLSLTPAQELELISKQKLLANGYPLDYLLSQVEISNLRWSFGPEVLIPREETEAWVNNFLQLLPKSLQKSQALKKYTLVDIGTGSGFIGLQLSKYFQQTFLVDISLQALFKTKQNARLNNLHYKNNLQVYQSDLLNNPNLLAQLKSSKPWILVANLPYLSDSDWQQAETNNIKYEPKIALYSGSQGLNLLAKMLMQITKLANQPKIIVLELDPRNLRLAKKLLQKIYPIAKVYLDPAGRERILLGKFDNL